LCTFAQGERAAVPELDLPPSASVVSVWPEDHLLPIARGHGALEGLEVRGARA
jgi:hypothetical protein